MTGDRSQPAYRTALAWQRSTLVVLAMAGLLFKTAVDDDQPALGAVCGGVLAAVALALYVWRGRTDGPVARRDRVAMARALVALTVSAAAVATLLVTLSVV